MSVTRDWLPATRDSQLAMAQDWMERVCPNESAWALPPAAVQELNTLGQEAEDALATEKNALRKPR
ncbi:MAG: hypothetical protein LBP88_06005 [Treponema sp.]|jgi:hypothetical protein|nr:hypothetical protein [Treponema sp.]